MSLRKITAAFGAIALTLAMGACGGNSGSGSDGESVTLQYWLWDDNQLPLYQQCADAFTAKNPNIKIEITLFVFCTEFHGCVTGDVYSVWEYRHRSDTQSFR